jgi:cell shape-determining protein MreC
MSSHDVFPEGENQIIEVSKTLPAILYRQTFYDEKIFSYTREYTRLQQSCWIETVL